MSGFEGNETKQIYILAKDQVRLEEPVDVSILEPSEVLKNQYESLTDQEDEVRADNVEERFMKKVIQFLKMYKEDPMRKIEKPLQKTDLSELVQQQYADFINEMNYREVFQMIDAANYLGIESLLSLGLAYIAIIIKRPTVDEFKKLFTIHNDLTPDEEAKFRRECLIPKRLQGVPDHEGLH